MMIYFRGVATYISNIYLKAKQCIKWSQSANLSINANRLPMSDPWTNLLIQYSGTHKQITSIFHIDYLMSARASVGDNRYICTWLAVMMLVLYLTRHVVLTLCVLNCLAGALTCISDYINIKCEMKLLIHSQSSTVASTLALFRPQHQLIQHWPNSKYSISLKLFLIMLSMFLEKPIFGLINGTNDLQFTPSKWSCLRTRTID